jgi:hypothetical protein
MMTEAICPFRAGPGHRPSVLPAMTPVPAATSCEHCLRREVRVRLPPRETPVEKGLQRNRAVVTCVMRGIDER